MDGSELILKCAIGFGVGMILGVLFPLYIALPLALLAGYGIARFL